MAVDSSLFADVADAFAIESPAIVEKDYYAVKLLQLLIKLDIPEYDFIFSGGTCLSKAYQNTFRMSEDLDIKLIPTFKPHEISRSKQRLLKSHVHNAVITLIEESTEFSVADKPIKRNEGNYQQFTIEYPKKFGIIRPLRPELKLEITSSELLGDKQVKSIRSMFAEALKESPEITEMDCVSIQSIACEKFVSLLRRTAMISRDDTKLDDERLIRHAYDLHLIDSENTLQPELSTMVQAIIKIDQDQFGKQHHQFITDSSNELKYGLKMLRENPIHKARYQQFIDPLVYHPSPASWEESLKTIQQLSKVWL